MPLVVFDPASGAFKAASGAWEAGDAHLRNLQDWIPLRGDPDADTLFDLPMLRTRSADAVRNIPLAGAAIDNFVDNAVGIGLTLQAQIDADYLGLTQDQASAWQTKAERLFNHWAESTECDAYRALNFACLQALALRSTLENGDAFALLLNRPNQGDAFGLKVQLIEADLVSNPNRLANTPRLAGGIQRDEFGAVKSGWISNGFPNRLFAIGELKWTEYPFFSPSGRRLVLHIYHQLRINQSRGVPILAPVIELLKQVGRYTQAEIDAAVVAAFLAIITKTPRRQGLGPAAQSDEAATDDDKTKPYKLGPAMVLDLVGDEDVQVVDPKRPNSGFDPFFLEVVRQIGARLDIPGEVLMKQFTQSYSAARAALEAAKRVYIQRRTWMAASFCQPVYETFITEAVLSGRLNAPGFIQSAEIRRAYLGSYTNQWIGPSFGTIDPTKEYEALEMAEAHGWMTNREITAAISGGDWECNMKQRTLEEKMKQAAGMFASPAATPRQPQPYTPDNPG